MILINAKHYETRTINKNIVANVVTFNACTLKKKNLRVAKKSNV